MPNRNEILHKMSLDRNAAQDKFRRLYLKQLHQKTGNDTIIYFANFNPKVPVPDSALIITNDDISGFMTCINKLNGNKLDLILHSPGGSAETVMQIVNYLRSKYKYIRAIIPQNAMSAATMLACACDEIVMGKESAIGPIDPQIKLPIQNGGSIMVPAHSVLQDFANAKSDVLANPALSSLWIPKLLSIPMGFLDFCQKCINVAKSNVALWLNQYMFKDESIKNGEKIAEFLGNFNYHGTHGNPLNFQIARDIGLKVSLLEDDDVLQDRVLSVYHAALLTFEMTPCVKLIENHKGAGSFTMAK